MLINYDNTINTQCDGNTAGKIRHEDNQKQGLRREQSKINELYMTNATSFIIIGVTNLWCKCYM